MSWRRLPSQKIEKWNFKGLNSSTDRCKANTKSAVGACPASPLYQLLIEPTHNRLHYISSSPLDRIARGLSIPSFVSFLTFTAPTLHRPKKSNGEILLFRTDIHLLSYTNPQKGFQVILAPQAENPGRQCPHKSRLTIMAGKPGSLP